QQTPEATVSTGDHRGLPQAPLSLGVLFRENVALECLPPLEFTLAGKLEPPTSHALRLFLRHLVFALLVFSVALEPGRQRRPAATSVPRPSSCCALPAWARPRPCRCPVTPGQRDRGLHAPAPDGRPDGHGTSSSASPCCLLRGSCAHAGS